MEAAPLRSAEFLRHAPSEAASTPADARRPETRPPSVLLVGSAPAWALRSLEDAAEQAKLGVAVEAGTREADAWLEEHRPAAIVVDASARSVDRILLHLRYNPMLANVPILGVAGGGGVSDLAFEEVFGSGGDDLVPGESSRPLARRLRRLASVASGVFGEATPAFRPRGLALVADADRRYRVLSARVLRNAGYDVVFAVDESEVLREAIQLGVSLVVSRLGLAGSPAREGDELLAARARRAGMAAPWIVATTPKEWARARRALAEIPRLALYDAFGPPENLLFVANELMRLRGPDGRSSPRLLFGSSVRFRPAGADEDEIGYSYNLSAGGLYVRTLAPLEQGSEVWLELLPPRSERRVRLEGEVVWARGFGSNDAATVPPGFGVRITGGSKSDLDRFARSYRAFSDEMLNPGE